MSRYIMIIMLMNCKFIKYRIAVEFIRPDNGLKLRPSGLLKTMAIRYYQFVNRNS
jgi:hypothetical protein